MCDHRIAKHALAAWLIRCFFGCNVNELCHIVHRSITLVDFQFDAQNSYLFTFFFCCGAATQRGSWPPHSWGFLHHTQRHTTVGRTPMDEWSSSSQRPLPDNTQHSQKTNIHAHGGIRTHDLSRRAAADLRLRPRGCWDRHINVLTFVWKLKGITFCPTQCIYVFCVDLRTNSDYFNIQH